MTPLTYENLGEEEDFVVNVECNVYQPFRKANNDLVFLINWRHQDEKAMKFWISLCGTEEEAKAYEYTIKIESSADRKAGRSKFLLTGIGECLSSEVSHEDVKKKPTEVMCFSKDILKKAAEGQDEKRLEWTLVIKKI